jgi:4-aminobutyrate aminotransferase
MAEPIRQRTIALTRTHESSAGTGFLLGEGDPPVFVRGEGAFLFTETGERYLDLLAGSAVTNLGHGLPAHRAAIERVLDSGILHIGTRLLSTERAELCAELAALLPAPLSRIHFANAGTEAVEIAIKAAQFQTGRLGIVAFEGSYHGRTLGALSVSARERQRTRFGTVDQRVSFLPYPYRFRAEPPAEPAALLDHCLGALADHLAGAAAAGALPACILLEPIQGGGGVIIPPTGFLRGVRDLASAHGVLLIADEVWSGIGRAGRWFAFEHDGVVPDLVCIAKGLTAGLPLAVVAGGEAALGRWPAGIHSSTFQGNPLACAMARATLAEIRQRGWLAHSAGPVADCFARRLRPLQDLPNVRAARWIGAQAAIELADRAGRPDLAACRDLRLACLARRILVYGGGGWHGNTVIFLPPINIDIAVLDQALAEIAALVTGMADAG